MGSAELEPAGEAVGEDADDVDDGVASKASTVLIRSVNGEGERKGRTK